MGNKEGAIYSLFKQQYVGGKKARVVNQEDKRLKRKLILSFKGKVFFWNLKKLIRRISNQA